VNCCSERMWDMVRAEPQRVRALARGLEEIALKPVPANLSGLSAVVAAAEAQLNGSLLSIVVVLRECADRIEVAESGGRIEARLRAVADELGITYDGDMTLAEFCIAVEARRGAGTRYVAEASE
jgi:hypothetical protein